MRRHLIKSLIISFIFIYPQITPVAMASRGLEPVLIKATQGNQVGLYQESHTLMIEIDNYSKRWLCLRNVVKDAKDIAGELRKKGNLNDC